MPGEPLKWSGLDLSCQSTESGRNQLSNVYHFGVGGQFYWICPTWDMGSVEDFQL